MKRFFSCIILALALAACGKNEGPGAIPGGVSYSFRSAPLVLSCGDEAVVDILVRKAGSQESLPYDWEKDDASLSLSPTDPSVVEVRGKNRIAGLKPDSETRLFLCEGGKRLKSVEVKVNGAACVFDPDARLGSGDVFRKKLSPDAYMQSFDFDSHGNVYILGAKAPYLYVTRFNASGAKTGTMKLAFFGHGTSCSVEETSDGVYLWVPSFASQDAAAAYKGDRMISRVRFEDGRTWSTDDLEIQQNSWYIGDYTGLCPSFDAPSGLFGIQYASDHTGGDHDASGMWVRIYDYKDVMSAPLSEIKLRQITRGGETGGPVSSVETIFMTVKAHDLSRVTPKYRFSYNQKDTYGYAADGTALRALQGFSIGCGRAWFLVGYGPNRDASYSSYSYSGEKDVLLKHFDCINDLSNLTALGLTESSYEPEGIKIKDGSMYLGFGGKVGGKSYASILKLPK